MNDTEELMAESPQLSIELRERAGKGAARTTRRAGRVPGVIYGAKQEPLLISLAVLFMSKSSFWASK